MVPFPKPDTHTDGSRTEVECTWITVLSVIRATGIRGHVLSCPSWSPVPRNPDICDEGQSPWVHS